MKPISSFEIWLSHGNMPSDLAEAYDLALALTSGCNGRYSSIALPKPGLFLVTGPHKPDLFVHANSVERVLESLRSHMGMDPGDSFEAARMFEKEMTG